MSRMGWALFWAVAMAVCVGATLLAITHPIFVPFILGAVVLAFIFSRNVERASAVLGGLSLLAMRPGIFGERYSIEADGLAILAGLLAVAADIGVKRVDDSRRVRSAVFVLTILLWVWLLVPVAARYADGSSWAKGFANVPLAVGALLLVMRSQKRRSIMTKIFMGAMVLVSISFVITALVWFVSGAGTGLIAEPGLGYKSAEGLTSSVSVYFPMTPSAGFRIFGGVTLPRFLVLGREPGMGALAIIWTYFMLPRVGWRRRWIKPVLLIGLAGTLSTAGFGVFLIIVVIKRFIIHRGPFTPEVPLKQMLGLGILAYAAYLAYFAPVFGVASKQIDNAVSYSDRSSATVNGLKAIFEHPFGAAQDPTLANPSINILGAVSSTGVIALILTVLIFWMPLRRSPVSGAAAPAVGAIFLTVLLAQPFTDSAALYVLTALACCTLPLPALPPEPAPPKARRPLSTRGPNALPREPAIDSLMPLRDGAT